MYIRAYVQISHRVWTVVGRLCYVGVSTNKPAYDWFIDRLLQMTVFSFSSLLWELLVGVGGSKDWRGESVEGDHSGYCELCLSHITFKKCNLCIPAQM